MRVESSVVSYEAAHRFQSASAVREEIVPARIASAPDLRRAAADSVELSSSKEVTLTASVREDLEGFGFKEWLSALTVESIAGHRINWRSGAAVGQKRSRPARGGQAETRGPEQRRRTSFYAEAERLDFNARGTVKLEDGRSIEFSVSLKLERSFFSYSSNTGPANAKDPLVVNFGGGPARIGEGKVAFDLNADGQTEQIPFFADGTGFLAFDANGDGKVNDGSELFGPQTGQGFTELAQHDSDGNGWVDSADTGFAQLGIWTRDGFASLAEYGIGALSTSSAETPFAYKDARNELVAQLQRTGLFLTESGAAGTVQQIDLAA